MPAKPRDRREFIRLSVTLPDHPKLGAIDSPLAGWLYVVSMCWAGEHKTDGLIVPAVVIRKAGVPTRWSKELLAQGLWHAPGHDCSRCDQPPDGRYIIHDYLDHQRSKAEAEAASQAGRAAADRRWASHAKGIPDRTADGIADPNGFALQKESKRKKTPPTPPPDPGDGTDGYPTHIHHDHAHRWCVRVAAERRLPLSALALLAWCYRLGAGDPWAGHRLVDESTLRELDTAHNAARTLTARLRAAAPPRTENAS